MIQAIPYLLGFHPVRSLVLVGLAEARVTITARLDLADLGEPTAVGHTVAVVCRGATDSVIGVVFDDSGPAHGPVLPWSDLVAELGRRVEAAGCSSTEMLYVAGGRWWSYLCDSPACCPPGGSVVPEEPSAFAAAATVSGTAPLRDRSELEATLEPGSPVDTDAFERTVDSAEAELAAAIVRHGDGRYFRLVKRELFAAARTAAAVDDRQAARFALALEHLPTRDAVWLAVDDGRIDGRPLWTDLARRAPGPYAAAPLFLLGWASWRHGDGALARIAAQRALRRAPGYTAAELLVSVLHHGLGPQDMPRLRPQASATRNPRGSRRRR